jgi:hypothetical protein
VLWILGQAGTWGKHSPCPEASQFVPARPCVGSLFYLLRPEIQWQSNRSNSIANLECP